MLKAMSTGLKRHVFGDFPNEASTRRLVCAILLEQNNEWGLPRRYVTLATPRRLSEDTIPASTTLPA